MYPFLFTSHSDLHLREEEFSTALKARGAGARPSLSKSRLKYMRDFEWFNTFGHFIISIIPFMLSPKIDELSIIVKIIIKYEYVCADFSPGSEFESFKAVNVIGANIQRYR